MHNLTANDERIIRLICNQKTSKQIAYELNYTTRTVEDYRKKIMKKTKVINSVGLVVFAIRHGIYKL